MDNILFQFKCFSVVLLQIVLRIFPITQNKVISLNFSGRGYGDNGKYVCNALLKMNPNMRIIWPISAGNQLGNAPAQVRAVPYLSMRFFYHLVTSKIWLSNSRIPCFLKKRRNQYYIQLWHGAPALKRIEKDVQDRLPAYYVESAKEDSKKADLFISNSKYWSEQIKSVFWYDGPILECGQPRLDPLLNRTAESKFRLKQLLCITEKKVLLYAPTFRANMSSESYMLDYQHLKRILEEKTGQSWHICVRFHPNITNANIDFSSLGVTNISSYPDLYELFEVFDMLITDYSSLMFEAAFANIPVILFATDIEKYRQERNFYFELENLPFPIACSNKELWHVINTWDQVSYTKKVKKFSNKLNVYLNGTASFQVAKHITNIMKEI